MPETLNRFELAELTGRHPIWVFNKIPEIKKNCKGTRKVNGEWKFPLSAIDYLDRSFSKKKTRNPEINKRFEKLISKNNLISFLYKQCKVEKMRDADALKSIILTLNEKIEAGEFEA